jgi:hypothetical protein
VLADVAGGAPRWAVTRTPRAVEGAAGSVQLVRLWAAGELAAGTARHGRARIRDVALAHRLNIVTPVSGAVVLETNRDYGANGLPVPDPDAVPTLPEPETWALLILTIVAGGWMIRRRARPSGVAA